ncbi:ataxin-7-like protein 1 isoform X1 [Haliotis rufescens]|uniref:ataxin-7-like protein 1 isoform X1 n=1 Tax=Haliotis rufescens TaxID=6454 RepID=UPI001EAFF004|nr:ataxin-7-like protein 1 isoform X1 [Haliotis rufescens]
MATQDRSPSLFAGKPWSVLADSWSTADEKESDGSKESEDKDDNSDSMKLRKDDKYLFGICPSQDEFYLVVCEKCNQVIKPQALKRHMVNRHGLKDSKALIKAAIGADFPKTGSDTPVKEGRKSMPLTKASLKQPPQSNLVPKMASLSNKSNNSSGGSSSSMKKSHTMPVVKMERIPEQLAKRTLSVAPESGTKPVLTNGTVKTNSSGAPTPPTPPVSQPTHATMVSVVTTTTTTSKNSISSSNMTPSATTTVTPSPAMTTVTPAAPTVPPPTPTPPPSIVTPPSSNKKSPKERKFLPCKDREFDPDKHCGCWIPDIAKQCTRSLTCKTHALSLRRAVKGRSKTFDELLKEHRAAKELLLKQKAEMAAKAAAASGGGAGPGGGGSSKSGHSDSNAHSKDGVAHSKVPHPPSMSPTQKNKSHAKPHNSVFQRPTSTVAPPSLTHIKEEPTSVAMDTSGGRLSMEDGDDEQDRVDATYLPYHPQPAAMCRFGARFNGSGCHAFSRRADYVRAAFLSALERHLHPPPHKKLCVESNLPKEPLLVTNSKDPYEFNMDDVSGGSHNFIGMINSANKSASKPKSKSSSSSAVSSSSSSNRTSKSPRDSAGSRSPGSSSGSVVNANPAKRKRSSGSQGGSGGLSSVTASINPNPAISNVIGTMAALNTHTNPITAIAIPNLGGATIGHFNPTLTNKQNQVPKNNINIKDFNLVLTGIDSLNGQYIASAQLADLTTHQQVVTTDDKNTVRRSRTISGNAKTTSGAKLTNNLDTLKTLHNNSVIMSQNAVLVDGLQGAVLAPVNLTTLGNSSMATSQASPSTAPSPMFRTDALSPHVSLASPLPNGIVSSPSGKHKSGTSHRHTASLKQGHNKVMNLSPGLLQANPGQLGTQLCTSQTLTAAQLAQLQVKPGMLNMKGMTGKITMQPMSVIMNPALTGQQGPQHTLLVTTSAEDGTAKQPELHLQQISNSPSNVIS